MRPSIFIQGLLLACGWLLAASPILWGADCNKNGVADSTDIAGGTSRDCNGNGVPDECDLVPTFSPEPVVKISVGASNVIDVVSADLDGDGDLDLATANSASSNVMVLRNDGERKFVRTGPYSVGTSPWRIVAGDLDGDADADLVTCDRGGVGYSVLLNRGDGSFPSAVKRSVGFEPWAIALADLDGDGALDLAIAGGQSNLQVRWNMGDGTLGGPTATLNMTIPQYPNALVADDLDGDGSIDLAIGCSSGSPYCLAIVKNRGDRTFASPVTINHSSLPGFLATADFDGNGAKDLVMADKRRECEEICDPWGWCETICNIVGDTVSVLMNRGGGAFSTLRRLSVEPVPNALTVADLDRDGDEDIISTSEIAGKVSVLLNRGDGTFENALRLLAGGKAFRVAAADLDGDGSIDIATANGEFNNVGVIYTRPASRDLNQNLVPDECEDCDRNGFPDDMDLSSGRSQDCNRNELPDSCDIASGLLPDSDGDGVPDDCTGISFRRGDVNADGAIDIADAISALSYLFASGPCGCLKAADPNDSGQVDIADAIYVLNFIFAQGDPPAAPFDACGKDPTADVLTCASFQPCQ